MNDEKKAEKRKNPFTYGGVLKGDYYKVQFRCLNCMFLGDIEVPRGQTVRKQPCPYCGCKPYEVD